MGVEIKNSPPGWKITGNSGLNDSTNFLGTTDNVDLKFKTNNTVGMTLDINGFGDPRITVGLTQVDPSSDLIAGGGGNLMVVSTSGASMGCFTAVENDMGSGSTMAAVRSRGTLTARTETMDGDILFKFQAYGYGSDNLLGASAGIGAGNIFFVQDGSSGVGFAPGKLRIITTNQSGANADRVTIRHDGKFGLGDNLSSPVSRLHVKGTATTEITSILQAVASQSVNITEWRNSSAGVLASISQAGILTLGLASSQTGTLKLNGTTSGTVTIKTADAAGTYTLTLPVNDGDADQVLTTDGDGNLSWEDVAAGSGATTALDNLAAVAINAALVLGTSDAFALGSATKMWSDLFLASGAVINFDNGNATLTHSSGTLTLAGTLALGSNNLTMTGSLGATGARLTKGWFTDLEVTNAIVGSITGNAATVTGFTPASGSLTLSGADALTLTTSADSNVTLPTTGTLATLAGTEELDNKTLDSSVGKGTWTASGTWTLPALTLGGNATLAENVSIVLDSALSADGKYCGITEAGTAGATLAFGDLVYFSVTDSRWELTDADADSTSGAVRIGICVLAAASDGDPTTILLWGKIRADSVFPTFTVGAPVYVGTTAGDVQTAQPSATDDVIRIVGYGNTGDELFFCPSNDYMTHT